ncbi:SagB/ThcOx family dehydrogenase [Massilia sp. RP-1-19]|uniref:SagB/ThcOx family dehydrogenase n=1 Tax=Massilia polaris TaxID=2728846 RepID=A0A848HTC7_9BURK|nr:SagB family peptide dehydrogenase [Massilia polaris]NML61938.1 SagB/ThcOx family dehydrogenase [Massilia polaris]
MPKLAWVLIPLAAYAAILAVLAWRGRAPARLALNVQTSLLLLAYLLATAGLGIFWVANQQLPVFDWHYLFGYATLALMSVHLVFNLPIVLRWFARKQPKPQPAKPGGPRLVLQATALAAAFGVAYFVGTRQAGDALPAVGPGDMPAPVQAVIQYHAFSSASRGGVFKRAPGVEWGSPPPVFKRYGGVKTIALARGATGGAVLGEMLRAPAGGQGRLGLAALGELLYLSSGITQRRGGNALRAAPSSGALFPSELYVAARSMEGLAPGLYHYDPEHHRLDVLGPLPVTLGASAADRADAAIVLSSIFRRTGYKYHNRAYRYAAADAGHLLENVRLAAHGAGMHAQLLPAFDDDAAARAIAADGVEEGVLALVALNRKTNDRLAPERFTAVGDLRASAIGVTGLVQRATSLRHHAQAIAEIVSLPAPEPASRGLHETIVNRRSERRFGGEAMPLAALSSLLADAAQPVQLSDAVTLNIVVNRVAGLPRGIYRYLPGHALQRVRSGDFQAAAQSAALSQDVIGDAAAVLILSADRDQVLAQGARGYRHVLIEAGLVGERWLLGATARGLAGCPVGAFYDDEAAALLGADPQRHWVLHFAAVGPRAPP